MAIIQGHSVRVETATATIDISEDTGNSTSVDVRGKKVLGIVMPSAMTGSTFKLQFSLDDTTFKDVVNSGGTDQTFSFQANDVVSVDQSIYGIVSGGYVRIDSAGVETADREFTLILG